MHESNQLEAEADPKLYSCSAHQKRTKSHCVGICYIQFSSLLIYIVALATMLIKPNRRLKREIICNRYSCQYSIILFSLGFCTLPVT